MRCGWGNVRGDYYGFGVRGTFGLRAVCCTAYFEPHDEARYTLVTVTSNEVVLRVLEAKGAEAHAVKLIRDAFPEQPVLPDPDARDPDSERALAELLRRRREAAEEAETRRGNWMWKPQVAERVRREGKSHLFAAAARFYGSVYVRAPEDGGVRRRLEGLLEPAPEPDALSPFMRGLLEVALVRWKLAQQDGKVRAEALALAERLLKDHAGTAIAQETEELLARAKAKE